MAKIIKPDNIERRYFVEVYPKKVRPDTKTPSGTAHFTMGGQRLHKKEIVYTMPKNFIEVLNSAEYADEGLYEK